MAHIVPQPAGVFDVLHDMLILQLLQFRRPLPLVFFFPPHRVLQQHPIKDEKHHDRKQEGKADDAPEFIEPFGGSRLADDGIVIDDDGDIGKRKDEHPQKFPPHEPRFLPSVSHRLGLRQVHDKWQLWVG